MTDTHTRQVQLDMHIRITKQNDSRITRNFLEHEIFNQHNALLEFVCLVFNDTSTRKGYLVTGCPRRGN